MIDLPLHFLQFPETKILDPVKTLEEHERIFTIVFLDSERLGRVPKPVRWASFSVYGTKRVVIWREIIAITVEPHTRNLVVIGSIWYSDCIYVAYGGPRDVQIKYLKYIWIEVNNSFFLANRTLNPLRMNKIWTKQSITDFFNCFRIILTEKIECFFWQQSLL